MKLRFLIWIIGMFLIPAFVSSYGELLGGCDFETDCEATGFITIFNGATNCTEDHTNSKMVCTGTTINSGYWNLSVKSGWEFPCSANNDMLTIEMNMSVERVTGSYFGPIISNTANTNDYTSWIIQGGYVSDSTYFPDAFCVSASCSSTALARPVKKEAPQQLIRLSYNCTSGNATYWNETEAYSDNWKLIASNITYKSPKAMKSFWSGDPRFSGDGLADYDHTIYEIWLYNGSNADIVPPDTTPPEITFYNMTSEGGLGCTNWNTDKNNACETSDTTPTVLINTSEKAFCRIGVSDLNYTDMGISRNCTGGGTKKLTCTLILQDELTQETSYIYIGCKDKSENENLTSTSGALKLSLATSDAESSARDAIESGIQNTLLSGYTLYTDQKIYARNSANNQSIGVFDKVVKWMNKIWSFNYITGADVRVNMFNITPVLYTLELENKSISQITNEVELLINTTK
jgi:hypothetical protein